MIGFLRWLGIGTIGFIIIMIAACIIVIVGYILWQITKHICEGIEKGMDDR